jgi:hypothetical protein
MTHFEGRVAASRMLNNLLPTAAHRRPLIQFKDLRGKAAVRRTLLGRPLFGGGIGGCVAMMGGLWFAGLLQTTPAKADSPSVEEAVPGDPASNTKSASPIPAIQPVPEPQTWVVASSGLGTLMLLQRFRRKSGPRKR